MSTEDYSRELPAAAVQVAAAAERTRHGKPVHGSDTTDRQHPRQPGALFFPVASLQFANLLTQRVVATVSVSIASNGFSWPIRRVFVCCRGIAGRLLHRVRGAGRRASLQLALPGALARLGRRADRGRSGELCQGGAQTAQGLDRAGLPQQSQPAQVSSGFISSLNSRLMNGSLSGQGGGFQAAVQPGPHLGGRSRLDGLAGRRRAGAVLPHLLDPGRPQPHHRRLLQFGHRGRRAVRPQNHSLGFRRHSRKRITRPSCWPVPVIDRERLCIGADAVGRVHPRQGGQGADPRVHGGARLPRRHRGDQPHVAGQRLHLRQELDSLAALHAGKRSPMKCKSPTSPRVGGGGRAGGPGLCVASAPMSGRD